MRIIAFVKQVPGTDAVKMDPKTGVMIRTGKDTVINPLDEHALGAVISLKEKIKDLKITVLSMGPLSALKAIKEAIAQGADDGVLVCGKEFAGSDTMATARAMAAAIKKMGNFEMIIGGERATDGETGQTAAMIAHFLHLPIVTYVSEFEIKEKKVLLKRTVEGGFENLSVGFPLMISANKDIGETDFPTLKGKIRAKKAEIKIWSLEDLGINASEVGLEGSPTRVVKIFTPNFMRSTIMHKGSDVGQAVLELQAFLKKNELIKENC